MVKKTWMPTVAGILNIVTGAVVFLGGLILVVLGTVGGGILRYFGFDLLQFVPIALFWLVATPALFLGTLTLAGGIYTLQRKMWGLALASSIIAFIFSCALGAAAIIFTVLSKDEFE